MTLRFLATAVLGEMSSFAPTAQVSATVKVVAPAAAEPAKAAEEPAKAAATTAKTGSTSQPAAKTSTASSTPKTGDALAFAVAGSAALAAIVAMAMGFALKRRKRG